MTVELSTLGSVIKTAYEAEADTNAYTDAEKAKLAAVEALADVTDATNVTAAGALMDSEVTNLAAVKAFDPTDYATAAQGSTADTALQAVSDDTTPTLGGALDAGGFGISNLGDVLFKTGAAGGTLRTGTSAADKFQLQAYDVDGAAYVTLIEADAGNDVRLQLPVNYLDLEDATDTTKIARLSSASITTGTTRTYTFPDASGTFLLNVAEDTTPQLGGSLDVNGQKIVSASNGNIDIEPNGTGNVLLGNFTFDADQTVGAGQDNYVLTYDNASGLISLEAAAAGSGDFKADGTVDMTGEFRTDVGTFDSDVANGASAVAFSYDTAVAYSTSGAKLANWKNNGTEKAYLDKDGYHHVPRLYGLSAGNVRGYLQSYSNGFAFGSTSQAGAITNDGILLNSGSDVNWSVGDPTFQAMDSGLSRSAAGVLKVTNGSTGNGAITFSYGQAAQAYTVATLPGTPAVGMMARVTDASAPAVGSTVSGGGAAAAMVWYNGANWTVIGV